MTCKTFIPLVIFFFSSLYAHTQGPYIPSITKGSKITQLFNLGMGSYFLRDTRVTCDSLVFNGKKYYRTIEGTPYNGSPYTGYNDHKIYLREDTANQQVYYLDVKNPEKEILYLDYDLEVGDTFPYFPEGHNNQYSTVIDTIYQREYMGLNRKVLQYKGPDLTLIEGLGRNFFGILPPSPPSSIEYYSYPHKQEILDCKAILDTTLIVDPDTMEPEDVDTITVKLEDIVIYPNPYTDYFKLEFKEWDWQKSGLLQIFTMDGWLIHERKITKAKTSINTARHPAGVLIAKVYYDNLVATFKIVHFAKPR
ncbi:MAG: T9SS type A sorting domain-containing protein [Chitinophagales bacterium]|nr:T9SS type A sorting domain-containing protein [Chitinophagales bacterium]